jgi:hypothetical protein
MGPCQCQVWYTIFFGIIYLYDNYRPVNKEELFNLRHASLCNVVERIFGVLKRRFRILLLPPEYSLDIQARIPVALSAIHNFICTHEPGEEPSLESPDILANDNSDEAPAAGIVEQEADVRRDSIAQELWDDYLRVREERGTGTDEEEVEDGEDEESNHSDESNSD